MVSPETDLTFQAPEDGRLDVLITQWLAAHPVPDRAFSRSQVSAWIEAGLVTVGKRVLTKPATRVQLRTHIAIRIPPPTVPTLLPESHTFVVLHEDRDILVIDKPAGLRVHPTAADPTNSLVAGILGRGLTLAPAGGALRLGVVHRLDKTTSGLIVLARTDAAYFALVEQFRARSLDKRYLALTLGHLPHMEGEIDSPLGRDPAHRKRFAIVGHGKPARTGYRVAERTPLGDRVELTLYTGRTHQIRVHLRSLGAPVMGDALYGGTLQRVALAKRARTAEGWGGESEKARRSLLAIGKLLKGYPGNCLHAWRLAFTHPVTQAPMSFEAPLPAEVESVLELMRSSRS